MGSMLADPNILLVEPSGVQAKLFAQHCKELDLRSVTAVQTGTEALKLLEAGDAEFDIVISALYLPDMTGTKLVTILRNTRELEGIPFVLVSSETRPQALDPVRQAGVCGILPKPYTQAQLRQVISTTMDYLAADNLEVSDVRTEELRVLLVDDSPSALKFMRRVLENLGVREFIEAHDGAEAAMLLGNSIVDLVVTDYNMPEMDGHKLVEYIRTQSWQKDVPILMVTSESDVGRLAAVQAAGVSGICDKPFDPSVVSNLLGQLLAGREHQD